MTNENLIKYIARLSKKEGIDFMYNGESRELNLGNVPKNEKEIEAYSNFWGSFFEDYKNDIEKVLFYYKENPTKIPLKTKEKILNLFGGKIKNIEIPGELKAFYSKPISVEKETGLVKLFHEEEEFRDLEKRAKKTNDFIARHEFIDSNLKYTTKIPLKLVTKVKLKGEEKDVREYF